MLEHRRILVKVCGITNLRDAINAARAGADAIGFIFAESPRKMSPEMARRIIRILPPFITTVGVFVNAGWREIKNIMEYCGLDMIQLHGDESPSLCEMLMPRTLKAIRVKDRSSLEIIKDYKNRVRAILLDSFSEKAMGGTGVTFNWELGKKAMAHSIPVILSGGLNPQNISDAITMLRPAGVDVNTGVEIRPGVKSFNLMKEFILNIRGAKL